MRLPATTKLVMFCGAAALFFFSCKTAPAPTSGTAQKTEERQPAATKGFSREDFGKSLENFLNAGKYDEALALFDTIPETDAADPSIQTLKLSILVSAGKLAEAAVLADKLEAQNPNDADILYVQAVLAGARKDQANRKKYLSRVLEVRPNDSQAMTALGLDYYSQKDYERAKSTLVKAIASDHGNPEALLGLARVYYMQADLSKAENSLNMAIEKTPEYSVLWAERARVKSETKDLPGAIEDVKKAIALNPTVYGHWIDYGNYLISDGEREEAKKAFTSAIAINPDFYLAYIYRAGLNDDLGYADEAIADYTQVCVKLPEYYYAAETLGILQWGKGNWAASRAAFQQALSWSPKNSYYALMVTLTYYRDGKPEDAKKFMAKYITTLDRSSTEYFLCRLFVDRAGDGDVLNRIMKEKDVTKRSRMLFYSAMYYDLFQKKTVAQKFFYEVISVEAPGFFEYRLCQWALKDLEKEADDASQAPDGAADPGTGSNAS